MAAVVLLTGVARYLGGRMARLLSNADGIERIIGVDVIPPPTTSAAPSSCRPTSVTRPWPRS